MIEQLLDIEDVDPAGVVDVEQGGVVLDVPTVAPLEQGLHIEDVCLAVTNDARLQSADGSFYEISAFGNTTVEVNSASEIEANTPTESDTTANGTDAGQTTNGTEGLWILGGLAGLGSVGYVLAQRLRTQ